MRHGTVHWRQLHSEFTKEHTPHLRAIRLDQKVVMHEKSSSFTIRHSHGYPANAYFTAPASRARKSPACRCRAASEVSHPALGPSSSLHPTRFGGKSFKLTTSSNR